ncbi:bifunctional DNA primase/polymerase [Pengzhenrongella phosphoraccumulans]|uniref:bifunctional DNA primase/polymerase n=1 Tax=Pengzhenrongella phosphoraccumulans TaxID=3114394 RepID=UPI00388E8427
MDNTPDTQQPDMLRRALTFAAAGIPVSPCLPGGKPPLTTNGFHDATIDTVQIRDWWIARPTANIATPTGAPNFDVLDVDVRPDGTGWPAFDQAKHAGLIDGWIRAVRTPSGGSTCTTPAPPNATAACADYTSTSAASADTSCCLPPSDRPRPTAAATTSSANNPDPETP